MRAFDFRLRAEEAVRFFLWVIVAIQQTHNFYAMTGHSFFAHENMPSSVVAHMDYYPASATLRITYTSGEIYDYLHVPLKIYEAMKASTAKGFYLNKFIKGIYPYKKVTS
ncbi:KTSC domain-containing protein [Niastella sp. OAS944]|uniref:KTSC domain-containing protein n=2 Tax=Niastella sp. OAS944 TaxID=2664089 RepID=UPI0035C7DF65